jgi:hypothetical protein
MGTGFFLHAADPNGQTVRWASLSAAGVLGTEQQAAVPAHNASQGPWVALAGKDAAFDRVLIFFGAPSDADPSASELKVLSVPFSGQPDGGAAGTPLTLASLPSPSQPLRLSVGGGAAGLHAGVAFGISGVESFTFLAVDGAGTKVGGSQTIAGGAGALDFKCLRLTSAFGGPADMNLGYIRQSADTDRSPSWRFVSIGADGLVGATTSLGLSAANPSCPLMTFPPDGSIALAWDDPAHAWFVDWQPKVASQLFPQEVAAAATQPTGVLPPLAGFGALGATKFGILFDRPQGAMLHVVDANGTSRQGDVTLPARAAHVGALSSVPVGSSLYATYVDYDAAPASTGRRQWLRLACDK